MYNKYKKESPRLSEYSKDFNAVDFPWIPVIFINGNCELVSLIEFIERRKEIYWFSCDRPTDIIALMRFLSHLLYSSGYRNSNDSDMVFDNAKEILNAKKEKFSAENFLQARSINFKEEKPIHFIDIYTRTGGNGNIFRDGYIKYGNPSINVLLSLLSFNLFKSGRVGAASLGKNKLSTYLPTKSSYVNSVVCYCVGDNIEKTLLMNLIDVSDDEIVIPYWDIKIEESNFDRIAEKKFAFRESLHKYVSSYLGSLVPYRTAIRIDFDDLKVGVASFVHKEDPYFDESDPNTVYNKFIDKGKEAFPLYKSNQSNFLSEQTLFDLSIRLNDECNPEINTKISEYLGLSDISLWFGTFKFSDPFQTSISEISSGKTYCATSMKSRSEIFRKMNDHYIYVMRVLKNKAYTMFKKFRECKGVDEISHAESCFDKYTAVYRSSVIREIASGKVSDNTLEGYKEKINRMATNFYESMWKGKNMHISHFHAINTPYFNRKES